MPLRQAVRDLLGLASTFDGVTILPKFWCHCDRYWNFLSKCRIPFVPQARGRLPPSRATSHNLPPSRATSHHLAPPRLKCRIPPFFWSTDALLCAHWIMATDGCTDPPNEVLCFDLKFAYGLKYQKMNLRR